MMDKLIKKELTVASVTLEQDLDMVMNAHRYSCSFHESPETKREFTLRKQGREARIRDNKLMYWYSLIGIIVSIITLLSIVKLLTSDITDFAENSLLYLIACAAFFGIKKLTSGLRDTVILQIDNTNYSSYQLRILIDNKIYFIYKPNFYENNEIIENNFIAEVEPDYEDLIILDKIKTFQVSGAGIYIKSDATVRVHKPDNQYNPYLQYQSPVALDILIQRGLYPEEMLEQLGKNYTIKKLL